MAKKIVSLLVCLVMALSLLSVVTVSAAMTDEVTIYHNDCSVPDGVGSQQKVQAEFAGFTNQNPSFYNNHSTTALRYKLVSYGNKNNDAYPLTKMTSDVPTLFAGGTYKIRIKARVILNSISIDKLDFKTKVDFTNVSGYYNPAISANPINIATFTTPVFEFGETSWFTTEYELSINGFGNGVTEAKPDIILAFNAKDLAEQSLGSNNNLDICIDDITITQTGVPEVSVEVGENGTVSCGGNTVADGDSFYKAKGDVVTLDVTPADGFVAKATVNGAETPVENNQIKVAVNDDTAIDVKFEEIPVVNVGVDDTKTVANFTNANGEPTIYVYSKIANFTTGEDNLNYGIILGNGSWSEWLYALDAGSDIDNQIRSTAKPGEAYIIKVLGADVSESYTVQPFVGETTGNERTLSFAE